MPLETITLCRIAKKVEHAYNHNNLIEFNNSIWVAEPFLQNRWTEFVGVLQEVENDKCADVKIIEDNSSDYLEVVATCWTYKPREKKRVAWLLKICPFLFENFVEEVNEDFSNHNDMANAPNSISESTNMNRTYMTTQLYDRLFSYHRSQRDEDSNNCFYDSLPESFIPKLCDFQKNSLDWMLNREKVKTVLPSIFVKLIAKDGVHTVYKHRWCFMFSLEFKDTDVIELPAGGILAEEMGLGKTVEILALILLNPRESLNIEEFIENVRAKRRKITLKIFCICGKIEQRKSMMTCTHCQTRQHIKCVGKIHKNDKNDPYLCPQCWENLCDETLLDTKSTFIVSPIIIKSQWVSEVKRHVIPHLKVFIYEGLSKGWISPLQLTSYDIVITDYNVLRREVHYSGMNRSDRVTRTEASKMTLKSPLLMLNWWRVCLDEAQMVESNTSQLASLARIIPGVHRWAVTGTPIQQSMEDLLPLIKFVGIPEFAEYPSAWNNLIYDFISNHEQPDKQLPLIRDVLSKIMWRTCKSKVEDELRLPPQTIKVHRINLGLIEKIYYEDMHKECRETFDISVKKHIPCYSEQDDRKVSPRIMKLILHPLLKLRQCCTVSVVQSGTNVPLKRFLQPKELQAHLKSLNETDCKTALRTMASSHNAIGGLFYIHKNYDEVIKNYLKVVELADKYKDYSITVDSLLQIHALHNLILAHKDVDLPTEASPNIVSYQQTLDSLEWKYIEPYVQNLISLKNSYESLRTEIESSEALITPNLFDALSGIGDAVLSYDSDIQQSIFNRTINESQKQFFSNELPKSVRDVRSLIHHLIRWTAEIDSSRTKITKAFDNLQFFTNNLRIRNKIEPTIWQKMSQFITSVYDCHLIDTREEPVQNVSEAVRQKIQQQRDTRKKAFCLLCQIRKDLIEYECLLFAKVYDEATENAEGQESASVNVCLIKSLLTGLKTRLGSMAPPIIKDFEKHVKLLENIQMLCKKFSKYWIEIEYTVKAYDELDMCKMRISLTEDEDDITYFRIKQSELQKEMSIHYFNLEEGEAEFNTKFARLKYVINSDHNSDEMICPICTSEEASQFAVWECGHFTCVDCYKESCKFVSNMYISCSVCRHKQTKSSIHLLLRNKVNEDLNTNEYSSKIAAIIKVIWELQKEGNPKILIFSEWMPMLKEISKALEVNGITFCLHKSGEDMQKFKNSGSNITCLLMPYSKGSKGINLIEATHVFLVEPILNPAEELQAIGRVHRIGQTKKTTVHRFIVNQTIEEKMFNMVFQGNGQWDFENIKVNQIKNLFERES